MLNTWALLGEGLTLWVLGLFMMESGYPVNRYFASRLGSALMVKPTSRQLEFLTEFVNRISIPAS